MKKYQYISLTQVVNEPTHISYGDGLQHNILELILILHPDKYEVDVFSSLGISNTIFISFSLYELQNVTRPASKRSTFIYEKAHWNELNDFLRHFCFRQCKCHDENGRKHCYDGNENLYSIKENLY